MSMMSTNWRRVVLGGVCAGLVFNALGMAGAFLIHLAESFERFGIEPTGAIALLHSGLRLGLGFAAVLLYVGFRGGLGPGPWTAMRSSALVWFIGYVPGSVVMKELGVLNDGQLAFALAWGFAETVIATQLGAFLYREKDRASG